MSGGIVQVAVGLGDVGGSAHLGRLVARTLAAYAAEKTLPFEVLDLGRDDPRLPGIARTGFAGDRLALARAVAARQLARSRPRLIVFDHLGPARIQALLPRSLRSPHALFALGIEVWRPLSWQRRRTLASAARVFAISEATLDGARRFLPATAKVAVVHPALEDGSLADEADGSLLARAGTGFALVVGRLVRDRKGHDELLAAMAELRRTRPEARLVVAGDGPDRVRLERLAQETGLGEAVLFTGLVSEATLRELYARCALFVMPSRGEGFGLVFVEAMRAGKPCVALVGTAPAEIVVHGETGLLTPDEAPATLAAALARLLGDPEAAARLGAAGRARYLAEFTAEAFAARLRPHLDSLLP
ncbi:MAG TPA: glycosyltransferase [Thermoanaerobaculia bacterium]|nr:glycosyltransferase [Thermoanaerobaculia bacterium]